eukprot:483729_1
MKTDQKLQHQEYRNATDITLIPRQYSSHLTIEFIEPRESDYIDCQSADHTIENCNVVKRILYLLSYYHTHENDQIYQYLLSLKHYNLPTFLEDWHQTKKYHLRVENDMLKIKNQIPNPCNNPITCAYLRRYQRERENETYVGQIDYKNMIIKDQFDSIHTFIFHSMQRQFARRTIQNFEYKSDDEMSVQKVKEEQIIQSTKPYLQTSISECDVEHIIWIINNNAWENMTQKTRNTLREYKSEITNYINEHNYNGYQLQEMKRKEFINKLSVYFNNKKLKGALGMLYNAVIKSDIFVNNKEQIMEDIWSNHPETIQQCNVDQIACITDHIISNKMSTLAEQKQNIIKCIKQSNIDGSKLKKTTAKDFCNEIKIDLDDTGMESLYTSIVEYELSVLTDKNKNQ